MIFEEFNDWSIAENRPERQNWTNYMFEKHPYDMSNATSWDAQKNLANNTVSTLSSIQNSWNIPLLVGEFCLYYFTDVWDDFLSDLNEANISWTNWTYKARGTKFESGGGNWGYYNTYTGTDPDLMHDSYDEIKAIWQNTRTESAFSANQPLINTVSARADGSTNYPYVALDRTNWTILATHTSSDPYNPVGYMIDGDSSTRWSTGPGQAFGQSITINFGQSENFDKIEMDHDGSDYPGGYKVEISSDGINYTQVTLNNVDIIEEYTLQFEQAPDESPHKPCAWKFRKTSEYRYSDEQIREEQIDTSADNDEITASLRVNNIEYQFNAATRNKKDYKLNYISAYPYTGISPNGIDSLIVSSQLCRTEKPTDEEMSYAFSLADTWLEDMELGEWSIDQCSVKTTYYGDVPEYVICISAVPVLHGTNAIRYPQLDNLKSKDVYASNYYYTDAYFEFSANGDLM